MLGNGGHALIKERHIPSKLIDCKTRDPVAILGRQNRMSSDHLCNHPTTVNVTNQDHWNIGGLCETHIGNIPGAQVDFSRASGPLYDDKICAFGQAVKGIEHPWH